MERRSRPINLQGLVLDTRGIYYTHVVIPKRLRPRVIVSLVIRGRRITRVVGPRLLSLGIPRRPRRNGLCPKVDPQFVNIIST